MVKAVDWGYMTDELRNAITLSAMERWKKDRFKTTIKEISQLTFLEIMSVLLKCLPRSRLGVLHVPLIISDLDNARDLIEINLKEDNCFYEVHADGIVSLDLDFKM